MKYIYTILFFLSATYAHAQAYYPNYPPAGSGSAASSPTTPGGSVTGANQFRTASGTFGGDNQIIDDNAGGLSLIRVSSTNISATSILSNVISSTTYLGMSLPQLLDSRTNTASSSLVLGSGSGTGLTSGNGETLLGIGVGSRITTGSLNVGVGLAALDSLVNGSNNVAVGYRAMRLVVSSNNTGLGTQACQSVTSGASNLCIGNNADVLSPTGSNQLSIANAIYGNIGSGTGNTNLIGVNVTSPTVALHVSGTVIAGNCSTSTTSTATQAGNICYRASNNTYYYGDGAGSFAPLTVGVKVSASALN